MILLFLYECNERFEATLYEQPIDILLCVSYTLADNLLVGLSGLQTPRFSEITKMNDKKIGGMLRKESPDLYFSHLTNLLRKEANCFSSEIKDRRANVINYKKVNEIIEAIIHDDKITAINEGTLTTVFEVLEYCLLRNLVFLSTRKHLVEALSRILRKSGIYSKKGANTPELVSGVRLTRLLVNNYGFLMSNRYDNPFSFHEHIGGEWPEEVERVIRYTSRYIENEVYSLRNSQKGNPYETMSFDLISKLPLLDDDEKEHILEQFFALDNMEILLETNPEFLSYAILSILENNIIRSNEAKRITDTYLHSFLGLLKSVGLGYLEFEAVINTISIARYANQTWFLSEIKEVLQYYIFGRHPRSFLSILELHPDFVADLIELVPELFDQNLDELDFFFHEREFQVYVAANGIDYIRVFRRFYQLLCKEAKDKRAITGVSRKLNRTLQKIGLFEKINFAKLTISQIEDLAWYAWHTDNKQLSTEIRKYLTQQFGIHQCKTNACLEQLFKNSQK